MIGTFIEEMLNTENGPKRKKVTEKVENPFGEGVVADVAFDMYNALLDAPLPLDQHSMYAEWYKNIARPAVRQATRVARVEKIS